MLNSFITDKEDMRQRKCDSTKKYQDRTCELHIIFMDNVNETDTFAKNARLIFLRHTRQSV